MGNISLENHLTPSTQHYLARVTGMACVCSQNPSSALYNNIFDITELLTGWGQREPEASTDIVSLKNETLTQLTKHQHYSTLFSTVSHYFRQTPGILQ